MIGNHGNICMYRTIISIKNNNKDWVSCDSSTSSYIGQVHICDDDYATHIEQIRFLR